MSMRRPLPTQRARITWLVIYAVALLTLNRAANGSWLPAVAGEGLWFYTAAASLLLGDLVVSPYFVSPRDCLSFAVPAAIAVWAVIEGSADRRPLLGYGVLSYCLLIAVVSGLAMVLARPSNPQLELTASKLKKWSQTIGHPKALFSAVFLLALVQFHLDNAIEVLLVGGVWAILIGVQPERPLYWTWQRLRSTPGAPTDFGGVAAYQTPGVVLIRQESTGEADLGAILVCNDALGPPKLAVALDYTGRDQALLLRALEIDLPNTTSAWLSSVSKSIGPNRVGRVESDQVPREVANEISILERMEDFLGIVAEDTNVERLYFEVIREQDIEEGNLVAVAIRGQEVLYQIINGLTKEEIVHQKHKYGYARAESRKVGRWDEAEQRFRRVKWLPGLNAPVFRSGRGAVAPQLSTVGHFPGTNYPVGLRSVSDLVTHNTAILGILGIGKSMLAIELVERMLSEGIKVVCLDLTNQYANELSDWYRQATEQESLQKIQSAGQKDREAFADNPEEGGSFPGLRNTIIDDLRAFMTSESRRLKIYNPAQFAATRQESELRSFKDDSGNWHRGAALWSVTPVQVTQVVAETLLILAQDSMREQARVCLVLEEAHSLVPEWNTVANDADRNATNGTARAILQGRKYGFGCLLVTQRTANVTKTILNQCNTIFAMRTFDDTGKTFLANYIGSDYADILPTLGEREAVFFGKASTCENPVRIRLNDQLDFRARFRAERPPPDFDSVDSEGGADWFENDEDDIPF